MSAQTLGGAEMSLIRPELQDAAALRRPILRFLTREKFFSLLNHRAIWFSGLGVLQDKFEGLMPPRTKEVIQESNRKWKEVFPDPDHQDQLERDAERNEQDGRSMLAVNCWFADNTETLEMWNRYADSTNGTAIESSCELLAESIHHQEYARIGLVRYVDFDEEDMDSYAGSQAMERAFLKRLEFTGENELRIATMNIVGPGCLNPDGTAPSQRQLAGPGMFDPERPGFFIRVNLNRLVRRVVLAPGVGVDARCQIERALENAGLRVPIDRSNVE